jgi:hypothetical protein
MTSDPSSAHIHVWWVDRFPGVEIKSCNCGEVKVEEQPEGVEGY